jgi:putative ABC transport system permease protein
MLDYFASQVRTAFSSAYVLAGMLLVVVLMGMADTLAAGVTERARTFGAIRAVGVDASFLRRIVTTEALVLGLLGIVLALAGGFGMALLWITWTFPYLFGWILRPHLPYAVTLAVIAVTLVVCALAAVIPAARAVRIDPVLALRDE